MADPNDILHKKAQEDAIYIVNYNPAWVNLAREEIKTLKEIFSGEDWVMDIQHIGSTAVPGLAAKPIIDIYIGTRSLEEAQRAVIPLENLGYSFWKENPNKEKMFFVKGMPPFGTGRTHHIHVVKYDSDYWRASILFRDYLRKHSQEAQTYAALKYQLMQDHGTDREAYTDAKTAYIASVLKKAGFQDALRR
ncbi:MAG: hypothetical protein K0R52_793 [Alphaproteobacteria bacterium]|jgi:GrpB-like predicted nucleotidyltransferase (UPF0157 family)|nr:hypothetical protein [Alphaproteobacteria bacterium]